MKRFFTLSLAAAAVLSAAAGAPRELRTVKPTLTLEQAQAKATTLKARAQVKKTKVAVPASQTAATPMRAAGEIGDYTTLWTNVFDFCTKGSLAAPVALPQDDEGFIPESTIGAANYGFGGVGLYDAGDKCLLVKFAEGTKYGFLYTPDLPNANCAVSITFDVQLVEGTSESDEIDVVLCDYEGYETSYDKVITGNDWTTIACVFDASEYAKDAPLYFQIYALDEADILIRNLTVETAEIEVEPLEPLGDITGLDFTRAADGALEFIWDATPGANLYVANIDRIHPVTAGETLAVIDADFSSVESEGTLDEPEITDIYTEVPQLPGATVYLPATIPGAMGVQDNWIYAWLMGLYAEVQTGFYDLSAAKDGKVTFEVEACSGTGPLLRAGIFAYDETEGKYVAVDMYTSATTVGRDFAKYEFTLSGATDDCAFLIFPDLVDENDENDHNLFFRSIKATIACESDGEVRLPVLSEQTEDTGVVVESALVVEGDTYVANVTAYQLDDDDNVVDRKTSDDVYLEVPAGIADVIGDINNGTARYFNLQGIEIANPAAGSIYVRVADGKATKVLVK